MLDIKIKYTDTDVFGLIDDIDLMIFIRRNLRIYPIAIGSLPHSHQNKILGSPFVLNIYQLKYLSDLNYIAIPLPTSTKYLIFKHFTQHSYMVKDGMKFGCDFLIYPGDPLYCHAEAMVCEARSVNKNRLVELARIANDTNKKLLFAYATEANVFIKDIAWVNTGPR
jgi:tRNA intron endonuclease, catalytic C-terminal domain